METGLGEVPRRCHVVGVYPTLASLFGEGAPVDGSTWAFMALLAVVVSVSLGVTLLQRRWPSVSASLAIELAVVAVGAGFLGAKGGHVLLEAAGHRLSDGSVADGVWSLLRDDPWHWARLTEPGFVQLAGVVVAAVCVAVVVVRAGNAARVGDVADAAAIALAVGVAIGRVGCLFAGCCYGHATDVAWAVHFPVDHISGGVGLHPTQLYDVVVASLAAAVGLVAWRRGPPGLAALLTAGGLLAGRVVTELFRGDVDRGVFAFGAVNVSTSQLLGLGLLLVLPLAGRALRRSADAAETAPATTTAPQQQG